VVAVAQQWIPFLQAEASGFVHLRSQVLTDGPHATSSSLPAQLLPTPHWKLHFSELQVVSSQSASTQSNVQERPPLQVMPLHDFPLHLTTQSWSGGHWRTESRQVRSVAAQVMAHAFVAAQVPRGANAVQSALHAPGPASGVTPLDVLPLLLDVDVDDELVSPLSSRSVSMPINAPHAGASTSPASIARSAEVKRRTPPA